MPAREPDLLTKPEAAEKLRVSPSTLDRLRAQGEIAWVPVGRKVRFREPARAPPPAPQTGPRRRLPDRSSGFDELFPITMPEATGGGAR
jgi:excisionase family DNA binding protein